MALVVNILGGPCAGKSSICAGVFSKLKALGIVCELQTEVIKNEIYKENNTIRYNQIALFGETLYQIRTKANNVDVVVNDGSLLSNIIYEKDEGQAFHNLVIAKYKEFNNLDFFIHRADGFQTVGRYNTLEESIEIDNQIIAMYEGLGISFVHVNLGENTVDIIVEKIIQYINEKD